MFREHPFPESTDVQNPRLLGRYGSESVEIREGRYGEGDAVIGEMVPSTAFGSVQAETDDLLGIDSGHEVGLSVQCKSE